MPDAATVLYCVLQILNHGPQARSCHAIRKAPVVAYAVQEAAREYPSIPSQVLVALIGHESGFNVRAKGTRGEIGLTQIMRGGALTGNLAMIPDKVLYNPRVNVPLGARYLVAMQKRCGTAKPAAWLSAYNGRGCRPSIYSQAVLNSLKQGRNRVKFVLVSRQTRATRS